MSRENRRARGAVRYAAPGRTYMLVRLYRDGQPVQRREVFIYDGEVHSGTIASTPAAIRNRMHGARRARVVPEV